MEQELAQRQQVKQFIEKTPLATIATVSEQSVPQSAAVYTYLKEDLTLYFVSKKTTRKYQNIIRNNRVSLSYVSEDKLVFVEVLGHARVFDPLTEGERMVHILEKINDIVLSRNLPSWVPPLVQIQGGEYGFFEVTPYQISFYDFMNVSDKMDIAPDHFRLTLGESS